MINPVYIGTANGNIIEVDEVILPGCKKGKSKKGCKSKGTKIVKKEKSFIT